MRLNKKPYGLIYFDCSIQRFPILKSTTNLLAIFQVNLCSALSYLIECFLGILLIEKALNAVIRFIYYH